MTYPCAGCTIHVNARCTYGMTYPCSGCTAIARGLCTSLQTMTFLMSPSRSDTSILDVPESVQKSLSWTQSTAMPPTTHKTQSVQYLQLSDRRLQCMEHMLTQNVKHQLTLNSSTELAANDFRTSDYFRLDVSVTNLVKIRIRRM